MARSAPSAARTRGRTMQEIAAVASALRIVTRDARWRIVVVVLAMAAAAAAELVGIGAVLAFVQAQLLGAGGVLPDVIPIEASRFKGAAGIALLAALYLAKGAVSCGAMFLMVGFAFREADEAAKRLYGSYLRLPLIEILSRGSAQILVDVNEEVFRTFNFVVVPSIMFVANVAVAVAVVGFLAFVSVEVTVAALAVVGTASLVLYLGQRHLLLRAGRTRAEARVALTRWVHQTVGGLRDIRLLRREGYFDARFADLFGRFMGAERSARIIQFLPHVVHEVVLVLGMVTALVVLRASGADLAASLPVLAGFTFAGVRLLGIFNSCVGQLHTIAFNASAAERLGDELARIDRSALAGAGTGREPVPRPPPLREAVRLRDVSYGYPGSALPAVTDVDLVLPVGFTAALVGPSGAGKSTLAHLLLGLLPPQAGSITADGDDIHADLRGWFGRVGFVPQQVFLLDDTIARNVAFGLPDDEIDADRVRSAMATAQLDDFLARQPDGLAQVVGENGVRLSGGERQRLGIARALYADPELLVLDEAVSALDALTERRFADALARLTGRRIVVVIAHSLTTARRCDTLHFLDGGRLVASGSFEEVTRICPAFRRFVEADGQHRRSA